MSSAAGSRSADPNFRDQREAFVLPGRNQVTMTAPMMRAYTDLLVRTGRKRGAFAIGGMAAFILSRRDAEVNAAALTKVRADKERDARDGFAGRRNDIAGRRNDIAGLRDDIAVGRRYLGA